MRAYKLSMAALSLLAFIPTAIHSQGAAQSSTAAKKLNPNEIVCEKQNVPGSRLAAARVCKTRAEWADLRLQDRLDLERAQTQRGAAPQ
jgi:hypothetical protein